MWPLTTKAAPVPCPPSPPRSERRATKPLPLAQAFHEKSPLHSLQRAFFMERPSGNPIHCLRVGAQSYRCAGRWAKRNTLQGISPAAPAHAAKEDDALSSAKRRPLPEAVLLDEADDVLVTAVLLLAVLLAAPTLMSPLSWPPSSITILP